jgi:hypothetical protein
VPTAHTERQLLFTHLIGLWTCSRAPTRSFYSRLLLRVQLALRLTLLPRQQTTNARQVMQNTPSFQQAWQRLEEKLKRPIHSQMLDFWDEDMRNRCLGHLCTYKCWTAFYVWRFPANIRDYELFITTKASGVSAMVSRSWEIH